MVVDVRGESRGRWWASAPSEPLTLLPVMGLLSQKSWELTGVLLALHQVGRNPSERLS